MVLLKELRLIERKIMNNIGTMNILALAYLGDAIYEVYIRTFLLQKGIQKVNELQRQAKQFVSAKGQAGVLKELLYQQLLTEQEIYVVKRARNHKSHKSPKNTDIVTYKQSTGLEALFGYLFLTHQTERINERMKRIVGEEICMSMEKM